MQTMNPVTDEPRHGHSPGELGGRTTQSEMRPSVIQTVSGANSENSSVSLPIRLPKAAPDTVPSRPAECRDDYPAVVYLSDTGRVIECRDGIQWIVQRRRSVCPNSWRGVSYCRTKQALLRCAGTPGGFAMERLHALPDRFPEECPSRRRRARDQERPHCLENGSVAGYLN
jgi:hypothetical protein